MQSLKAKSALALAPLLVACGAAAGCSSGGASGAEAGAAVRVSTALSCGTVVDPDVTGYYGHPLTVTSAAAAIAEVTRTAGTARFLAGTLDGADAATLDTMAAELLGHPGRNKVSADAAAFVSDELSYSPPGALPDTSYARQLVDAIAALSRDCPSGPAPGTASGS